MHNSYYNKLALSLNFLGKNSLLDLSIHFADSYYMQLVSIDYAR